jgi:hypothetical protein
MVIYHIEVYVDSPLARLEKAAHDIAEVTSFSKLSVVAYLLADVTLELSPTILDIKRRVKTLPDGRSLERERAIIEIENPNAITYDTFMRLYRELREMFNRTKLKAMTHHDQLLHTLVQQLGGIPRHGKKKDFWEKVRQEWNRKVGFEEYASIDGLRIRYARLLQKVNKGRRDR